MTRWAEEQHTDKKTTTNERKYTRQIGKISDDMSEYMLRTQLTFLFHFPSFDLFLLHF